MPDFAADLSEEHRELASKLWASLHGAPSEREMRLAHAAMAVAPDAVRAAILLAYIELHRNDELFEQDGNPFEKPA